MPELGNITATKVPYTYCACENAFTWTFTFNDLNTGDVMPITLDGTLLTGGGVQILGPTILQEASKLDGHFNLYALDKISLNVSYDAGVDEMTSAIMSLGLLVDTIDITSADSAGARGWVVTFAHYPGYIPQLSANASGLSGGKSIIVWTDKLQNASYSSLSGGFTLTWRGNTTDLIAYNASALEMQTALERLPVIGAVNVQRCCQSQADGFTWTVEFLQVKSYDVSGYITNPTGPLDLINATSFLVGNDPQIKVVEARRGTNGLGAGLAYVYELKRGIWQHTFTLRGNDTSESDSFGCDVSIEGDYILIGAKGSSKKGRNEIQSVTCSADSGYFEIYFRGWTSAPIPWNVSAADLQDVFLSDSNSPVKTPALSDVMVSNWGTGGLCENNTATLTFTKPVFGLQAIYGASSFEVELITLAQDSLLLNNRSDSVVLSIHSLQSQVTPKPSDPLEQGSSYLFRKQYTCSSVTNETCLDYTWAQEAEFYPLGGVGKSTPCVFIPS
jgi:hypothetical protein